MTEPSNDLIENVTFDELTIGQSAQLVRTLSIDDIRAFAAVSGDTNPAHLDAQYAAETLFHDVIAHGMWGGSLISALLGTQFPGPGTIYLDQSLHFAKPVRVGDTLTVSVTVTAKDAEHKAVELDCQVLNQKGAKVLSGVARVMAPTKKVRRPRIEAPLIRLFDPHSRFESLLAQARGLEALRCAVVHPCDAESLGGALDAAARGLIVPVLVGPRVRIEHLAQGAGLALDGIEIVDTEHSQESAEAAAELAAKGSVAMLMKGSLHTDELLHAVLAQPRLRTARRMSHVFRFDVPLYHKPLLITDAALNIHPTLAEKMDIVQNAVDFARILGISAPKVGVLSAVETVNPSIPSTIDAAALCKMADRGQIHGAILDGPLAFDNAISSHAAQIKHIASQVAGDADILMVPDLESGNMLAKQLEYLAGATCAGIVLGARVPIALTSRADGPMNRVASAVLALLVAHNARRDHPRQAWAH
ncbi:bifunctional enoyl-CoA hydratase/phosphate acetyltransferase [Curvibacter sp. APW13]|uniref:bifunctional enoyl-CoA hydratase/phosphate acetyltransferase n=1 Tax=Curvibacter sp. APW13 TaxID=3077236 RepID=UPI0028DD9BE3|nr:bifunctional enoyl-CoA hydratase/phosphate acetyltransferase [Curvibacter sp. APW13]MDT8991135.1 bifunctional enoyl-CoA hydratase/phosphate acetyltransferase [Curvibacter sp. APW13]